MYFCTSKASKLSISPPFASAYVNIRQHTLAHVSTSKASKLSTSSPFALIFRFLFLAHWSSPKSTACIRQHTSAYARSHACISQHTSAYAGPLVFAEVYRLHTSARQHMSAYARNHACIRQHTSAYVSIRQHTLEVNRHRGSGGRKIGSQVVGERECPVICHHRIPFLKHQHACIRKHTSAYASHHCIPFLTSTCLHT